MWTAVRMKQWCESLMINDTIKKEPLFGANELINCLQITPSLSAIFGWNPDCVRQGDREYFTSGGLG